MKLDKKNSIKIICLKCKGYTFLNKDFISQIPDMVCNCGGKLEIKE